MSRDTRTPRSAEQWQELTEEQADSGLSQAAY